MTEQLIIESKKPVKFKPYCVRCGRKTKKRYYIDTNAPLTHLLGLFIGFLLVFMIQLLNPLRPWVPYCFRCQWQYFSPSKNGLFHIVWAILLLSLSVYLLTTECIVSGLLVFICVLAALLMASRSNKNRQADAMPFSVQVQDKKIIYTFTDGHYYEEQMQQLEVDAE